jgi:hypothetical protein
MRCSICAVAHCCSSICFHAELVEGFTEILKREDLFLNGYELYFSSSDGGPVFKREMLKKIIEELHRVLVDLPSHKENHAYNVMLGVHVCSS